MKRKLAAVVFNDIQGYTSLMQENEAHAIRLRQRHKEVVDRLTGDFRGRIIQYYGDGTLSVFDEALDAVRCALSMQREFLQSPQVPLRIGINAGEILEGPDGVYGDSVNIASRIERMSVPGSVLISGKVFDLIRECKDFETRELGQYELKNVRHPMTIHAVVGEGLKVPDPVELEGKVGHKEKTLMVLPFLNLTRDPEDDFFSDGITEQIIHALAGVDGLKVISRTSSFTYKDKQVNLRQLHVESGIDHVLEGSVRRHGSKVRINAQLIHAADDFHLWSETYNRETADAFQVQDEIALSISNKLKAGFDRALVRPVKAGEEAPTLQSQVLEHYHKGRYAWKQMESGYLDTAIQYFRKAVELDPSFYLAWAELAKAWAYKGYHNLAPVDEASRQCREAMEKAMTLDPDHPQTQTIRALNAMFYTWDWAEAHAQLGLATRQPDPDNFVLYNSVLQAGGIYLMIGNHFEEATAMLRKAARTDPLNIGIKYELARVFLFSRNFRKAEETIDQILRHRPDFLSAHNLRGWILFSMGRQREGIEAFEYVHRQASLPVYGLAGLAYAYARTSQVRRAEEMKELLLAVGQDLPAYCIHYDMALAHLGAQEYTAMFDRLNQAVNCHMPLVTCLECNPIWDEIKRFGEYQALSRKVFGEGQRLPL